MPIPFAILQCRIGSCVEQHSHHLTVEVRLNDEVGRCPACGQTSRAVHSRYHRHPAGLPISTSRTTLNIEVRRFYCSNPCCSRRTFAEQASDLIAPRARRTRRLAETQGRVGIVRRRSRGEAPDEPVHACEPGHGAAPGQGHADARRAGTHARRHRRLSDEEGLQLRHHRGGPGSASRRRPPPRTAPRRRWPAGFCSDRTSKSWPGTARPSTPVAPASVLPGPYRSPTVGTCSPTCARPSNVGCMAFV